MQRGRTSHLRIIWSHAMAFSGQVSAWQSANFLPISCNSVQPVPVRVEDPISPIKQSSSGECHEQYTLSQDAIASTE